MAWHEKILRVDLTKGTCQAEALNMEWAEQFLGQRGLATKYLAEEMDPKADPLSPENVLIFATGPLTGTSAATGGRYSVITKGALTGATACSNSGGYWGGELRLAGWDMVLITGKAKTPVYLHIEDDKAELLDARNFIWGESVWETEARIKERHQDGRIRIASIGRAGESLARYACIINDLDRAAGRSGVGAARRHAPSSTRVATAPAWRQPARSRCSISPRRSAACRRATTKMCSSKARTKSAPPPWRRRAAPTASPI